MAVKVIGKVVGFSDNTNLDTEINSTPVLPVEDRENSINKSKNSALNNVQSLPNVTTPKENAQEEEKITPSENDNIQTENKEIAFFTEPKRVTKKSQRHIFAFQAITAAAVCVVMLLLHLCAGELYDNLHLYFLRLFQW